MKKLFKVLLWTLVGIVALPIIMMCYLYLSADMGEPELSFDTTKYVAVNKSDTLVCGNSYMRYDSCGLWELYVVGSGEVRGAKQGVLTKGLMKYQEDVFINQIRNIIPSDSYLSF
ncbi:MAG: choloylglycine hydrolase, partial [Rikenellaceae bacterium]